MSKAFMLVPGELTLKEVRQQLQEHRPIVMSDNVLSRVESSCEVIRKVLEDKRTVYGINTGFGSLARQSISTEHLKQLQRNIVLSHACGTGELLSDKQVALILLLKINNLCQGYSGVRRELITALCDLYNKQVFPCIPAKGSVGASGDLAPLAHLALPLLGEGQVRIDGKVVSALEGLKIAGLKPLELAPKEGLALLNGLQASTALCMEAFFTVKFFLKQPLWQEAYLLMPQVAVMFLLTIESIKHAVIKHNVM